MASRSAIERPQPPIEALALPRLLATDDRPEILRLIERSLRDRYRCQFAGDAAQARRLLSEGAFEIALCDIEMPGDSGLLLAEEILTSSPHTAVVMVTAVDDPQVAARAFDLGVHGYLVKPFMPGQLLIATMNALRRRDLEISQRAHSEALEDRLQMLMDRAPVPIYIKDSERRYTLANRVANEMAGLPPGALVGLCDADIMPPEAERRVAESDRRILEQGGTYTAEETLQVGDEIRSYLTVKFPFVDDDGQITGISGISTDITDKKHAEELARELTISQERAIEELSASRRETVERLSKAIEHHDADTGEHISRMASVAAFLGSLYGLSGERVLLLRAAAPMHDVGKVATPDAVLRKPGPLSEEERAVMERHTVVGHEILAGSDSDLLRLAASIALTHHERWDGSGYPHGYRGDEIPIEGRIVAVADVFDALLSDRSYRRAMSLDEVTAIFRSGSGTHFDPALVRLLLEHLDEALSLRN